MTLTQLGHPFNLELILELWKIKIFIENRIALHGKTVRELLEYFNLVCRQIIRVEPIISRHCVTLQGTKNPRFYLVKCLWGRVVGYLGGYFYFF